MPTPYAVSSDLVSAWPAKSLAVATYLDSALAAKTDLAMTQLTPGSSPYAMVLADAGRLVTPNSASANQVTVTKQATVAWVTSTQLRVMNLGAGVVTLVADTGVTINGNVALKQYQGGTLIRTASDVWLFVPTASGSGMDLITPTSVAGTGVTLSGGAVSFSAATSISVNGCFTATYDAYMIEFYLTTAAAGAASLRLRLSGTDASGANYNFQRATAGGASWTMSRTTNATAWFNQGLVAGLNTFDMKLFRPAIAATTGGLSMSNRGVDTNMDTELFGFGHDVATAYDGLTFAPGSASTGTLRIYGLRNS